MNLITLGYAIFRSTNVNGMDIDGDQLYEDLDKLHDTAGQESEVRGGRLQQ